MPQRYDSDTVQQGLDALAKTYGNSRKARRLLLATEGIALDHSTLHRWKHRHVNRNRPLGGQTK